MHTNMRNLFKPLAVVMMILALLASGLALQPALAASLPPTSACSGSGTVTCTLVASVGTATLFPGTTVTIWGYAANTSDPAGLPGPTLVVTAGDTVNVNFTNNLPEASSLLFQGQAMTPDTTGATSGGGTKNYTFTASQPGTYLYEAGLTPNAQHQVAMGLYGVLVVRPSLAPGQAYDDASTAFDEEAQVVLSEYDPALAAAGAGFDMRNYHPTYFLINGKAYPGTAAIQATAGNNLLLRYVNAGLQSHAMSLLGLPQTLIGTDGNALSSSHKVVSETIAPGQTEDALVQIPADAIAGSRFPLYDANLSLRNSNLAGVGGMLTNLEVLGGTVIGLDTVGPISSGVTLTPASTGGNTSVAIAASLSDATTGGNNVSSAEYFIDVTGAGGSGNAMSGPNGSTDPVGASATIPGAIIAGLSTGTHTVFVHGSDSLGNWGAFASAPLAVDNTGPATSGVIVSPKATNGTVNLSLTASGSDAATGNNNVIAAEYRIDAGIFVPMVVAVPAPSASLSATIPFATVNALPAGTHTITVHSMDSIGLWGSNGTTTFVVDKTGPTTGPVSASPNPNNGAQPYNTSTPAVRVKSLLTDSLTNIAGAEGFIDTAGANGSGFVFIATDGLFNSLSENAYSDVALATINSLSPGNHTFIVHAKDAAGNWGATTSFTTFLIDKTAPTLTSISVSPAITLGATSVTLTVNGATDPLVAGLASGVSGGEYWLTATAPAPGSGTAFLGTTASIPVGSLAVGTYTVSARVRDAAGNWSTGANGIRTTTLVVAPIAIFSSGFETGNFTGWTPSTTTASRLSVGGGAAAMVGSFGMQAQGNNTNYAQYNFTSPAASTYDARFYFKPNGNNSTGKDIFAAATSSAFSTQVFRVRYRMFSGTPQVQIQLGASNANATWSNILGGTASNYIEVVWVASPSGAPNSASLKLYVNGVAVQTLVNADTSSVAAIRLGSITTNGGNGLMYFDAFASKRTASPLLGP